MSTALPLAAFVFGALGSTHCAAMCGGFATLGARTETRPVRRLAGPEAPRAHLLLLQHVGRIGSYLLFGALAGGLGRWVVEGPFARVGGTLLELLAGATLLVAGLALTGLAKAPLERIGAPLFRRLAPWAGRLLPLRSAPAALAFGAVWGLLPCGLVYAALAMATAAGSAASGALVMLTFGLGTVPMLLVVALLARKIAPFARWTALRVALGLALGVWGALHVEGAAARWSAPASATCACHHHG